MPLKLFQAFGVELEYMIVDARTLDTKPITDQLLHAVAGSYETEIEAENDISWSNELALHVVELKTTEPTPTFDALTDRFAANVSRINTLLAPLGGRLMPTAMHPWMDPHRELKLWPHDYSPVYETFNRIFDCRGHGWANLQSAHLNLPFNGDDEFGRLHAAIRLILPILPALTAASPIMDAHITGVLDNRLEVYKTNARNLPIVSGRVIPEPVFTRADYEREILEKIYAEMAPHDPEGILRYEWANARGAIARFDRGAIEIRVMDVQECPAADVAICAAVSRVIEWLVSGAACSSAQQRRWQVEPLAEIFNIVTKKAAHAAITNTDYLETLGYDTHRTCVASDLWRYLLHESGVLPTTGAADALFTSLTHILHAGPLAHRIDHAVKAAAGHPPHGKPIDRAVLANTYSKLCDCLATNTMFGV